MKTVYGLSDYIGFSFFFLFHDKRDFKNFFSCIKVYFSENMRDWKAIFSQKSLSRNFP